MLVALDMQSIAGDSHPIHHPRIGADLRKTIEGYGISIVGFAGEEAGAPVLRLSLNHASKQSIYTALQAVHCLLLSVEPADLENLVPMAPVRVSMAQNWKTVGPLLTRLSPDSLFESLETAALSTLSRGHRDDSPDGQYVSAQQEQASLAAMKAAGVEDPLKGFDPFAREQARINAEYQQAEDAHFERMMKERGF
jgi:hypothetical protein